MKKINYLPTSEELFVEHYLRQNKIRFIEQHKIPKLKYDNKSFRVVDFYLPKLNVYVEYFGMYNSTKEIRKEYDNKAEVYFKNNLPTIIIYPHELGIIDYAFHIKMLNVLKLPKFKNKLTLFKYKLSRYLSRGKLSDVFFILFSLYLLFVFDQVETGLTEGLNAIGALTSIFSIFYFGYKLLINIIDVFISEE